MFRFCKQSLAVIVATIALASAAFAQQPAPAKPAEGDPPPKGRIVEVQIPIGVLDIQIILQDSAAVKNIRDQITNYGTAFEEEIEKERKEIRQANQELARQRTLLAPEAFAEKRRQFEQRVVQVQRLVQQRQRQLDKSRNDAMQAVNKAYIDIVSKLAAERNLAVILRKDQSVFAVTSLDLTQEVLQRLNKRLPSVKVAAPGKEAAAAAKPKDKPGK